METIRTIASYEKESRFISLVSWPNSHALCRNAIMQLFPIIDEILTLLSVHGTNNCHRETVSMVGARSGNFDRRIDSARVIYSWLNFFFFSYRYFSPRESLIGRSIARERESKFDLFPLEFSRKYVRFLSSFSSPILPIRFHIPGDRLVNNHIGDRTKNLSNV